MGVLLSCKDLTKTYRDVLAFGPLSFDLRSGQGLFVNGPNGAGKTTLLSILAGLVSASSGEVKLKDQVFDPFRHHLRRDVGFVPASENSLFLNASVRENLEFWARLQGLGRQSGAWIHPLAEEWEFASYLDRPVRELSSGFRRRVALARAFLHKPALVLLDEPFAFLDNLNVEHTCRRLEQWLGSQKGALVVSSNVNFTRGKTWKSIELKSISNPAFAR